MISLKPRCWVFSQDFCDICLIGLLLFCQILGVPGNIENAYNPSLIVLYGSNFFVIRHLSSQTIGGYPGVGVKISEIFLFTLDD
jgi:hypothetical protein